MKDTYQVFARKYRPQTFRDVVSQTAVVTTLKNAIRLKRTAHAYLFCGCRGTGKTTLARLFAKALNCAQLSEDAEPCGACSSCREIAASHAIDVLEIDGASHRGIEDIRQINETIAFAPTGGHYKIYLIDEVHMLTKEAFNALLKTLEEPPSHVKFFFCTTEPHKIPATILSRCQRFNLQRIPGEMIVEKLQQIALDGGISAEHDALSLIADMSEGSLRDALSLFDQIAAFEKGTIAAKTVAEILGIPSKDLFFTLDIAGANHDLTAAFKIAADVFTSGKNVLYFLEELLAHFRTLLLVKHGVAAGGQYHKRYVETSAAYRPEQLVQILEWIVESTQTLKHAPSERTAVEILLLRIVRSHRQLSLESLVNRLLDLEKKLSISEDPVPAPEDIPSPKNQPQPIPSVQEQSRFDTIMRFAAKELNGSLKKE